VLAVLAVLTGAASGTGNAGILAGSCGDRELAQPFARWVDPFRYTLVPGGGFEPTATGWKLQGGASVVRGNEPWSVRKPGDLHSLSLPRGSTATTPPVCVETLDPTLRFFGRNRAPRLRSTLSVEAVALDSLGRPILRGPIGRVAGGSAWRPTLPMLAVLDLAAPLGGGDIRVSFTFRPLGPAASWQIDDVFVDPLKMG
jgi:hypothetical protein